MLDEIKRAFDSGKTLVFPTEVAARSNLSSYLVQNQKALFRDRSISWDTFKLNCTQIPQGKKASTLINRILFADLFFERNATILKYYSIQKFPEALDNCKDLFVRQLPYFKQALDHRENIGREMAYDIELAVKQYQEYLEAGNLYEKEYLEPDFSSCDAENTVLVCASGVKDFRVEEALKYLHSIEIEQDVSLTVWKNTLAEVRSAARNIYKLLQDGEKGENIAITLTDYDKVAPYLEDEAYKRSIKLNFINGKNLVQYPSGSFFTQINNLASKDFEFEALRGFLLNPAFPFSDIEKNRAVVRELAENNAYGGIQEHLRKLEDPAYLEKLASYVKGIAFAKDCNQIRSAVNGFQDDFFKDGSFTSTGNEIDIDVFRKCMDILDLLEDEHADSSFDTFLRILSNTRYTPNEKKEGIKVYSYPVSCGLNVKYHFVLGVDDESTRQRRLPVDFIKDNDLLKGSEIGAAVIKSFSLSQNIFLSCSLQTFSGAVTPAISVKDKVNGVSEEDSYTQEVLMWRGENGSFVPGKAQAEFFKSDNLEDYIKRRWKRQQGGQGAQGEQGEQGAQGAQGAQGGQRRFNPKYLSAASTLSATSIKEYETCPFRYKCRYIDLIEEAQLDPKTTDALEIGNILHKTYQQYFTKNKTCSDLCTKEAGEELKSILNSNIRAYSHEKNAPDSLHLYRLSSEYSEKLIKIVFPNERARAKFRLEDYKVSAMEKAFSFDLDGATYCGRIDCILEKEDGTLAVLDFKKNTVDRQSVQVFLYAMAIRKTTGKEADQGAYYSIDGQKFADSWTDSQSLKELEPEIVQRLNRAVSGIKEGNFEPTPTQAGCASCSYSRICRTRYVIK